MVQPTHRAGHASDPATARSRNSAATSPASRTRSRRTISTAPRAASTRVGRPPRGTSSHETPYTYPRLRSRPPRRLGAGMALPPRTGARTIATAATLGMLAELETVLAEAEELRYRILCAVRNNAAPRRARKTSRSPRPRRPRPLRPPNPSPNPARHLRARPKSGRGLFAWAKQHTTPTSSSRSGKPQPSRLAWSTGRGTRSRRQSSARLPHHAPDPGPQHGTEARATSAPKPTRGRRGPRSTTRASASTLTEQNPRDK